MKGKVIFIGAGPGDPELITVKNKVTYALFLKIIYIFIWLYIFVLICNNI